MGNELAKTVIIIALVFSLLIFDTSTSCFQNFHRSNTSRKQSADESTIRILGGGGEKTEPQASSQQTRCVVITSFFLFTYFLLFYFLFITCLALSAKAPRSCHGAVPCVEF